MNTQQSSTQIEFDGIYGKYSITAKDKKEVLFYRLSLLLCSISFFLGLIQWIFLGPSLAWIWLISMAIGLGGSLKWIHIYLKPLHKALQILWGIGCILIFIMMVKFGPNNLLQSLSINKAWVIGIGPLFAALTGVGFKEFFCFRRLEAIGLTLLMPIALLGYITSFIDRNIVILLLFSSALLLLIMAINKFSMDPSADIGDKSVFDYLEKKKLSTAV